MRILFITDRPYLPQQIGGREMVIHETIQALASYGSNDNSVMSCLEPKKWLTLKNRVISRLTGVKYPVDVDMGYKVHRGWDWKDGLKKVVEKSKPDIAVVECTSLKYSSELEKIGIPSVVRLHDSALNTLGGVPKTYRASQFIAVSNYLASAFEREFGIRPTEIPPIVRKERCVTQTTRKGIVFVNPRFVKGSDIVLAVAKNCPDIPFVFFHGWTMDEEVKDLMLKAKNFNNIQWRPSVMNAKEIYKDAHTVLIPSRGNETWGRIATEAHFNAIPAIASRRGGLVESVGSGGVLLEPDAGNEEWTLMVKRFWNDRAYYSNQCQSSLRYSQRPEISSEVIMDTFLKCLRLEIELFKRS